MRNAIVLSSPCTSNWFNIPNTAGGNNHQINIISNKIDRAFNGIAINGMWDMPTAVQHNSVNIEDDYTFNNGGNPAAGYGISVENKLSNVSINNNTLTGQYSGANSTNSVSLIHCNFIPNGGASVACNVVSESRYGFEFEDYCDQTTWIGNRMCDNWAGIALTGNGIIGQQGSATGNGCGNSWGLLCNNQWHTGIAQWQTYAENSDANLSPLYCVNVSTMWLPTWHLASGLGSIAYSATNINSLGVPFANPYGDCWQMDPFAGTYPLWRGINTTGLNNVMSEEKELVIEPNPTTGKISIIKSHDTDFLVIKLFDISGKIIQYDGKDVGNIFEMDLSTLNEGVYLIEINTNNQFTIHKKVIKIN